MIANHLKRSKKKKNWDVFCTLQYLFGNNVKVVYTRNFFFFFPKTKHTIVNIIKGILCREKKAENKASSFCLCWNSLFVYILLLFFSIFLSNLLLPLFFASCAFFPR